MGTEQESGQNVERRQLHDLTDLQPEEGEMLIKGLGEVWVENFSLMREC